MMPIEPWNYPRSPASIELMLQFARKAGAGPNALLAGTRLTTADLKDPAAAITATQELAVIKNLLKTIPLAAYAGLEIGLSYQLSAYGLLGYGLLSSANGEAALALARRFLPLTYTFASIAIVVGRSTTHLTFAAAPWLTGSMARFVVERAMGASSRVLRDVMGPEFRLESFVLSHPGGRDRAGLATVLGTPVRHAGKDNTISVQRAVLKRALPQANPMTARMCERMCRELLMKRSPRVDTATFIRERMANHSFAHPPRIGEFARMLNTSERTLKRRLAAEGTNFRMLSNTARLARANALLREGRMSLTQIAADLGFSEPTTFSQAYKKWAGVAPSRATLR